MKWLDARCAVGDCSTPHVDVKLSSTRASVVPLCRDHRAMARMMVRAEKDGKLVPSFAELSALWSNACSKCGARVYSGVGPFNRRRSLQHEADGSFAIWCHGCNARDGVAGGRTARVREAVPWQSLPGPRRYRLEMLTRRLQWWCDLHRLEARVARVEASALDRASCS